MAQERTWFGQVLGAAGLLLYVAMCGVAYYAPGASTIVQVATYQQPEWHIRMLVLGGAAIGGWLAGSMLMGHGNRLGDAGAQDTLVAEVCIVLAVAAAMAGQIALPQALLLAVFAAIAAISTLRALRALATEPIEIQSNWGGLGGGLGGWRLSGSAVLLLVGAVFAGAATLIALPPGKPEQPAKQQTAPDSTQASVEPANQGRPPAPATPTPAKK